MLNDVQTGTAEDVFKCVTCGHTTPARTVDGTGPLDVEQRADDMYRVAVGVLRQQVCGPVSQAKTNAAFASSLMLPAEKLLHVFVYCLASLATGIPFVPAVNFDSRTLLRTASSTPQNKVIMLAHTLHAK